MRCRTQPPILMSRNRSVPSCRWGTCRSASQRRMVSSSQYAAAHQLQEGIAAERLRIVLVLVATGDLEDPLPHQRLDGMGHRSMAPLRDVRSQGGTQTKGGIGFREPDQAAITGQLGTIEARVKAGGREVEGNRLRHGTSPGEALLTLQPTPRTRCPVSPS